MKDYRKAVVAVVGALVVLAAQAGVEVAEDVSEAVITLVTAVLVYAVPND